MLNEKIDKLIKEVGTAAGMLSGLYNQHRVVEDVTKKLNKVISELKQLKIEIETEKAIDNCRLRILEMMDEGVGDCGVDENGRCIGYAYDGGACDECRTCAYSVIEEEK